MTLFNIFNERKEQLDKQKIIDDRLSILKYKCPDIVIEYLLLQRAITRNQQYKIINTNLLFIYDEMNNQLKVNNFITNRFLNTNIASCSCEELKKIILEG